MALPSFLVYTSLNEVNYVAPAFYKLIHCSKIGLVKSLAMGSHHRQVAILVQDEKLNCF